MASAADGQNLFRVEAKLAQISASMRPGMEGVAKVDIDERNLFWIWTRELRNWVTLSLWKWFGV